MSFHDDVKLSALLILCEGNGFLTQRASEAELWCPLCCLPEQAIEQTVKLPSLQCKFHMNCALCHTSLRIGLVCTIYSHYMSYIALHYIKHLSHKPHAARHLDSLKAVKGRWRWLAKANKSAFEVRPQYTLLLGDGGRKTGCCITT